MIALLSKQNAIPQSILPPVDLYLIFEKSSWKNQVRQIGFLVYFELDFTACGACTNQFRN